MKIYGCFDPEESEIINLRDIPYDQAREEIKKYFEAHHGENLYSHDITKALCIDIEMVDNIIEKLEREGQIKEVSTNG
jgi:transposase